MRNLNSKCYRLLASPAVDYECRLRCVEVIKLLLISGSVLYFGFIFLRACTMMSSTLEEKTTTAWRAVFLNLAHTRLQVAQNDYDD